MVIVVTLRYGGVTKVIGLERHLTAESVILAERPSKNRS